MQMDRGRGESKLGVSIIMFVVVQLYIISEIVCLFVSTLDRSKSECASNSNLCVGLSGRQEAKASHCGIC